MEFCPILDAKAWFRSCTLLMTEIESTLVWLSDHSMWLHWDFQEKLKAPSFHDDRSLPIPEYCCHHNNHIQRRSLDQTFHLASSRYTFSNHQMKHWIEIQPWKGCHPTAGRSSSNVILSHLTQRYTNVRTISTELCCEQHITYGSLANCAICITESNYYVLARQKPMTLSTDSVNWSPLGIALHGLPNMFSVWHFRLSGTRSSDGLWLNHSTKMSCNVSDIHTSPQFANALVIWHLLNIKPDQHPITDFKTFTVVFKFPASIRWEQVGLGLLYCTNSLLHMLFMILQYSDVSSWQCTQLYKINKKWFSVCPCLCCIHKYLQECLQCYTVEYFKTFLTYFFQYNNFGLKFNTF